MREQKIQQTSKIQRSIVLAIVLLTAQVSAASQTFEFDNGITATVHSADEIAASLSLNKDGSRDLVHPAVGSLALEGSSRGWFPYNEDAVIAALETMSGFQTRLDVDVFILPAPPAEIGSSFARRGAIYLSPGIGNVPDVTIAYITVHEMGHVMTWAFLDSHPARWDAYLEMRDLDASNLSHDAKHADRAREIVAEDFRFLFGGSLATRSGSIENHDLVTPDRVEGLDLLLAEFVQADIVGMQHVSARAFPNPCNPLTTIEMALDSDLDATGATLRIFDIRGALVKTLQGGHVANGRISLQWNGTEEDGGSASSGRYFYLFQAGQTVGKGSVTLIR